MAHKKGQLLGAWNAKLKISMMDKTNANIHAAQSEHYKPHRK